MNVSLRLALSAVMFVFAHAANAFTPYTGQWWNPGESGTGYNIDIRNGVLVMTVYSYQTGGDAQWYLTAGPMSADQRSYTGTLDQYRNGQCISCAYSGRPTLTGSAGAISIAFSSETTATLTLPGGRVTTIQPYFPALSSTGKLDGTYQLARATVYYLSGSLLDTAQGNFQASGTMVISGASITQLLSVTFGGNTLTLTISGTFTDYGSYLFVDSNGHSNQVPLVVRSGPNLVTDGVTAATSTLPAYSEVDQWQLVSTSTSAKLARRVATGGTPSGTEIGAAIGRVLTER